MTSEFIERRRRNRPLRVVVVLIVVLLFVYVTALIWSASDGTAAVTIALACAAVGMLLGFIFAIPKRREVAIINSAAAPPEPAAPATPGDAAPTSPESSPQSHNLASAYSPNTSLEEISDWLTKIVVGLGLVQAREIGTFIDTQGTRIAPILFGSAGTPLLGSAMLVATTVLSFLASYLYFRLSLARAFTESDVEANQAAKQEVIKARSAFAAALEHDRVQAASPRAALEAIVHSPSVSAGEVTDQDRWPSEPVKERELQGDGEAGAEGEGNQEGEADPEALPRAARTGSNLEQAIERKIALMRNQPIEPGDPAKGLFGGSATTDRPGPRSLTAKVKAVPGMAQWFQIDLKLASGPPKLTSEAVFFFHPTFPQPYERVPVAGGQATMRIFAYGGFTVGVLADDGATELELDLAELPDAPRLFREN